MTQDRTAPDVVKLRMKYKPTENMPASESLWAEPVEADQGGGSYRLRNSSFVVPLAAGDVVRAEQAGDGELQVTGLVGASGSVLTMVGAPPGAELDLQPVVEAWRAFVLDHDAELRADPARPVKAPRGELTWVELLEAQRLHAAQHYRQAATQVASLGHPVPGLDLATLYGMRLPDAVY